MRIVLVSTYELGRQPFGLASPAAWLRDAGHHVTCADLAVHALPPDEILDAGLVAFYLPMHTATRLASRAIRRVQKSNPRAHLCCYGLYAPINEAYLRELGVNTILGGEFEPGLVSLAASLSAGLSLNKPAPLISLDRLLFRTPDRTGLPALDNYAKLNVNGRSKQVAYTEASRGCKHLCRHCPVVPVYQGHFRIVQPEIVLEDIRHQVASGAEHVTFGDPDFFNGPRHATRIVEALHREFPGLTYDVTIKIEHLLNHRDLLPVLRDTGCVFVTSAAESVQDHVLKKLEKGHTRRDFIEVVYLFRKTGLTLAPTFIAFTPWITCGEYRDFLSLLLELDLVENVASVQLALRLLITAGSRLLELPEIRKIAVEFDPAALVYRWRHPIHDMDGLSAQVLRIVDEQQKQNRTRSEIFSSIWQLVHDQPLRENYDLIPRAAIPYMDEPWYC